MRQTNRLSFDGCNTVRNALEMPDRDCVAVGRCLLHLCPSDAASRRSMSLIIAEASLPASRIRALVSNARIQSPTLKIIFKNQDKITTTYESTPKGIVVVQTSDDPETVAALQKHATELTDLANRGMVAAHETMMKNAQARMRAGARGALVEPQHQH